MKSSKATSDIEKRPMVSDLNPIRMQMRNGDYACAVDVDPFRQDRSSFLYSRSSRLSGQKCVHAENLTIAIHRAVCEGLGSFASRQIESRPEHHR